ncbi:hypothetical protein KIN20_026779 [Parelaphostrongylus tenuis]|uniref:Cap-specific mRNA (nucleoside-2'-O-)-methyltransferase 1 n=1 Tax=Parelaphostrongylus tenuis TaxID=148309 RepID=A0AAD5QYF5_PARTN|nr:hypothetical protein KIN20_026779 [Parelaphostrongylus tenuis]
MVEAVTFHVKTSQPHIRHHKDFTTVNSRFFYSRLITTEALKQSNTSIDSLFPLIHCQFTWDPFGLQALFPGHRENVPNRHWIGLISQNLATYRWLFFSLIDDCLAIDFWWTFLSRLVGQSLSFSKECLEPALSRTSIANFVTIRLTDLSVFSLFIILLVISAPHVFENVNFVSVCAIITLCSSLIQNLFHILGWSQKVMSDLEYMWTEMIQLETALHKAVVNKHKTADLGLGVLHEKEDLRLKLAKLQAQFYSIKIELEEENQISSEFQSHHEVPYRNELRMERTLYEENSAKQDLFTERIVVMETDRGDVTARNESTTGACLEDVHSLKSVSPAATMMEKTSYDDGKRLENREQDSVEPLALSTHLNRVDLGHVVTEPVSPDVKELWDESREEKIIEEDVYWLPNCEESTRDWIVANLEGSEWIHIGEVKMNIDGETEFCDGEILRTMIEFKKVFTAIPQCDLQEARTRANPYETIGGAFFQNRAAMKLANLDRVFDFLFSGETEERLLSKNPLTSARPNFNCDREAPLFYFADVCAGPGAFSEYMLWRKAFYNAKGFGFTLRGENDFKFGRFTASCAHYLEPYYGKHGDGDVINPDNINSLEEFIMKGTNDVGVDFMMADGGFSVIGNEIIQEILAKRLYLCQLLVSLCIVRENGVFFCTLYDIFTPFSAALIFLMYVAYDQVALHKPLSSRPANSERYIVCKGLRKKYSDAVRDYLKRVNLKMDELTKAKSSHEVVSIVPIEIIRRHEEFSTYLKRHNERIAIRQSTYLQKYLCYYKNKSLIDKDQGTLRDGCLKYWLVPNKPQRRGAEHYRIDPEQYFRSFSGKMYSLENVNARLPMFTMELLTRRLLKELKYAEFSLNILSNKTTTQPELLISTEVGVFIWKERWEKIGNNLMRIPDKTVLLVERATAYKLVENCLETMETNGLIRILDAAVINGDDVSRLSYSKRMEAARKFCRALQLVIPKVRIGWRAQERYVAPPQLVTAEIFTFDYLSQLRRRFSYVRHLGEEVVIIEENGYLMICKALRVARLLKESYKMGWSCDQSRNYAISRSQSDVGSLFEELWEEHGCCSSFWETSMPLKQSRDLPPMQFIWSWENSMLDDYGPRVILESDSHKSGATINSIVI